MHALTFKQLVWIVRRAAVGFALWSASVRQFGLKGSLTLIMCVTYVLIGRQGTWALAYKRVVAAVLCCRVVEFLPPVSQWSMLRPGCIVAPACGIFGGVTPLRASDFVVAPPPPLGVRSVITFPLRHYYVSSGTQRGRGSSIVVRGCGGLVGCGCHCVHTCASLCIVVPAYSRISPVLGCYRCASSFGMRAGSQRAGLYVRIYPCTRGDNYFCDLHDCDLRATRMILPPLSRRLPFRLYCVAGCPSTCRI